jgi:hypothetical protein
MISKTRHLCLLAAALCAAALISLPGCKRAGQAGVPAGEAKTIPPGAVWVLENTTKLGTLTIGDNAFILPTNGHSVTLTVNGVEKDVRPGTYTGDVVVTSTDINLFKYYTLNHKFRQALYLDKTGVVEPKSVLAAAGPYKLSDGVLTGAKITSVGDNFNGIFVAGGTYTIKDPVIDFTGNGDDDFDGYGAAIMAAGKDTTMIVDGAKIKTHGAGRPTIVATRNSKVIVKNSVLESTNGILPADYVPNVSLGEMRAVPWMLGLNGNARATLLLGNYTSAFFINTSVANESWALLSADGDDENQEKVTDGRPKGNLMAVNSKLTDTGGGGYGNYFTASYYGTEMNVGDYGAIGGASFAASDPEVIAKLNAELGWGLTPAELKALPRKASRVTSGRFGVMVQRDTKVLDDTVIDTGEAVFLVKGASATITVDGSKGAQLNSKNGIILQILENDDPMGISAIYHEPVDPEKAADFDVTAPGKSDLVANISNITLKGDFYNGFPGGKNNIKANPGPAEGGASAPGGAAIETGTTPGTGAPGGGGGAAAGAAPGGGSPGGGGGGGAPGPGGPGGSSLGKNLVLTLDHSNITGVITASRARHAKPVITSLDYKMLGEVTNKPGPAVNNGILLTLNNSSWTVTGTSYLTSLKLGAGSEIKAPAGSKVAMTVDGNPKAISPGNYKGNIVISLAK